MIREEEREREREREREKRWNEEKKKFSLIFYSTRTSNCKFI
jgi:hypothetical protein